jgi:Ser/Thr protein kinase RdoA (MazF antagonist)
MAMISDSVVRTLAKSALRDFGFARNRLTQIANRHNDVFRVSVPSGESYALRLQSELLNDRQVRSQLKWLESLANESDVRVPMPVQTTDGKPFTCVMHAGVRRRAVLLRWLPGKTASTRNDSVYRSAAGMIARLHRHAETFRSGPGFSSRKLDAAWLFGPRFFIHSPAARRYLRAAKRKTAQRIEQFVQQAMLDLGRHPSRFGLIHADLNLDNIVFHRGNASPIDFDEFGRGWYLFDLAELIRTSITPDNWRKRKQLALSVYQQTRALHSVEIDGMDPFIVATFVQYLNWAFIHARHEQDLKWVGFCFDVIQQIAPR